MILHDFRKNYESLKLKPVFFCIFLLFYESASAVFWFIPPLLGVFFSYLIIEKEKSLKELDELDFNWYFTVFFLIFIEQIHGFEIFSSFLAYLIFYYVFNESFVLNLKGKESLFFIHSFAAYFGTFLLSNLILYIQNLPLLRFSNEYWYYIIFEGMFSLIYFRKKI